MSAPRRGGRAAEAGFTLLEVTVALAIITVAMLGLASTMAATLTTGETSTDTRIALGAVRGQIEDMRATDFSVLHSSWTGRVFGVAELRAPEGGGPHGSVTFLTEAEASDYLRAAGGPGLVDLDADGIAGESEAPAPGWSAYAVRFTVQWLDRTRADGARSIEVTTILLDTGA
jgi:prepilin-type N-terminal cleavage/methylation domain-containing protein